VRSWEEMRRAVWECYPQATMVISAEAVADCRSDEVAPKKIKKKGEGNFTIELTRNPDILAELGQHKGDCLLVGFATETEEVLPNAVRKLRNKNLDMIVANDVTQEGAGF